MAGDSEWVEEVRRWYLAGQPRAAGRDTPESPSSAGTYESDAIGYEAAHPELQSLTWPETSGATVTLR